MPPAWSMSKLSERTGSAAVDLIRRFCCMIDHANKRHWNSVDLDGSIEADELRAMIDHSYQLILAALPRRERPTRQ
jgi:YjbR